MKTPLKLILLLVLLLLACRLAQPPLPTAGPFASPTLLPPVPTSAGPLPATPTAAPTPAIVSVDPAPRVLILVLGSDFRPRKGFRTDVVMLLTIDPDNRTASAVSFPRDLYISIPGRKQNRINTVMQAGGFDLLADTFEQNFGVRPDYYVMADMGTFVEAVDGLGGVTVEAGARLGDKCDEGIVNYEEDWCVIEPGPVEMDGRSALWYVRSRHTSTDFDRLRRAQEVILAIFSRLMSRDAIAHLPEFYTAYSKMVQTNLDLGHVLPLVPAAAEIYRDPSRFDRYTVGRDQVTSFTTATGASVLLPNYEKIGEIINQAVLAP